MKDEDVMKIGAQVWMKPPKDLSKFDELYRFNRVAHEEEGIAVGWTRLRYAVWHAFGTCKKIVQELILNGESPDVCLTKSYPQIGFNRGDSIVSGAR